MCIDTLDDNIRNNVCLVRLFKIFITCISRVNKKCILNGFLSNCIICNVRSIMYLLSDNHKLL